MNSDLKIFAGNSNPDLALEICDCLSVPLGKALWELLATAKLE